MNPETRGEFLANQDAGSRRNGDTADRFVRRFVRLPEARIVGAEPAMNATAATIASVGGPGILRDAVPQLLARGGTFIRVAASRPEAKASQVLRLAGTTDWRGRTISS